MSRKLNFKGLDHYALGETDLLLEEEKLKIANIGDSGFDGVRIDTMGNNNWHAKFNPTIKYSDASNCQLKVIGEDQTGGTKVMSEIQASINDEGRLQIGVNRNLMPNKFKLLGRVNGEITYERDMETEAINPIIIAILFVVLESASFKYKHKKITTTEGETYTVEETVIDWNMGNSAEDTDGNEFEADEIVIQYQRDYGENEEAVVSPISAEITAKNTKDIIISNEEYS